MGDNKENMGAPVTNEMLYQLIMDMKAESKADKQMLYQLVIDTRAELKGDIAELKEDINRRFDEVDRAF